jgi:hypothetical protein
MIVRKCPFAWEQFKAWDFPTLWDSISQNHPSDHPVSYFVLAVIFFEETAFCNRAQAETPSGYGVGFGQLEVKNPEKKEFYEWLGISTDYKEVARMMLADNDTSVWTHCNYFQYLTSEKYYKLDGCLGAQVGSHTVYKSLFQDGAKLLEKAYNDNDRAAYIYALNYARNNSPKNNGIPENLFPEFWQFILPDSWFTLGY